MDNPLTQLNEQINQEEFRSNIAIINEKDRKSAVKAGETPIEWNQQENKSVLIKKDFDARWTKKNKEKEEVLIAINIESRISEKRIKKSSSHCRTKSFEHRKIYNHIKG